VSSAGSEAESTVSSPSREEEAMGGSFRGLGLFSSGSVGFGGVLAAPESAGGFFLYGRAVYA